MKCNALPKMHVLAAPKKTNQCPYMLSICLNQTICSAHVLSSLFWWGLNKNRSWIFDLETYLATSCNVIETHNENAIGLAET